MRLPRLRLAAAAALTAALWVVPSVGTQGQGTLGDRFVHPDRGMVAASGSARTVLVSADAVAARAVSGL